MGRRRRPASRRLLRYPSPRETSGTARGPEYVSEDRATLILNDLADALARNRDWGTPLGLTIGFGLSLLTADFKSVAGVSADAVTAVVVLLTGLTLIWTAIRVFQALRTPPRKTLVADAISAMENQDQD